MIVCLCKAVSDREIYAAIDEGHTTLKGIARRCGAGTGSGCGACHMSLRQMAAQRGDDKAETAEAACSDPTFGLAS